MRGINPSHFNACLPKLGKRKNPEGASGSASASTEHKAGTSGDKKKASAYPEQPNGILKKGGASKAAGAAKGKPDADPSTSGSPNPKRVKFNAEPEVREFGALRDLFSPRSSFTESAPRLSRSESMPADLPAAHAANDREPLALPPKKTAQDGAGSSAPPSSPERPALTGNPAHHIRPLDQYLAEHGARPMTLADHLEQPLTPSTLSPSASFLNSPGRMFPSREPSFEIPGSSISSASTPERPGPFGAWESAGGSPRLALPEPPSHLRAGWTDSSSNSSAGSPRSDFSSEPGTPAQRPGRFEGWESHEASPAASPRPREQPRLTRTASEVGDLFGVEGRESGSPAGHAPATPATPPAAEAEGSKPSKGVLGTGISGTTLAVGIAGAAAATILLGGQDGNGNVGT
jgi:hypothetical protein